jgi:hypothetical protein
MKGVNNRHQALNWAWVSDFSDAYRGHCADGDCIMREG